MSKRQTILSAIEVILKNTGVVPANKVFRFRVDPFDEKRMPFISMEVIEDQVLEDQINYHDRMLTIKILTAARGESPDAAIDPILEAIYQKLMEDRSLGGLLMDMSPQGDVPEYDHGDKPMIAVLSQFVLKYRTGKDGVN